jgi:hypothetical protein
MQDVQDVRKAKVGPQLFFLLAILMEKHLMYLPLQGVICCMHQVWEFVLSLDPSA